MRTKIMILVLGLTLVLSVAGVALANDVDLPRWVLSGGASDATGGSVALRATFGQPLVGIATNGSGQISLGQGFWSGGSLPEGLYHVYLPLVAK
jgi:hypothetical protein